ncbi:OB-fold domain-containing protein [Alicyclobacillus tolerans]|uniref:OB-fold domain-containing protein n=1 Tax=Alicyclobacillus tolerans TaxID=90970 RepID=UPI001F1F84D3|nr:OB-fold domain-containing protein [Alicyclobacillus tolerans]MCF8565298.1 OB-fold domain-containing protein [Alicyclobacillus tolerans]
MSVGIERIHAYIPRYRIRGSLFQSVWGKPASGARAVANYDEDALTMGVESALPLLTADLREHVHSVTFASNTPPYTDKSSAVLLSIACDLTSDVEIADFSCSLRAGGAALRTLLDRANATGTNAIGADVSDADVSSAEAATGALSRGASGKALLTVSEIQVCEPGEALEPGLGDGAVSLVIGSDPFAELVGRVSFSDWIYDRWTVSQQRFAHTGDARFASEFGYVKVLQQAFEKLLAQCQTTRSQISKVVYSAPDSKVHKDVQTALDLHPDQAFGRSLAHQIGIAGAAYPFLALAQAFDASQPGDLVALLTYGDGADAFLFRINDKIAHRRPQTNRLLAESFDLAHYGHYLKFRNLVAQEELRPFSSEVQTWRELAVDIRRHGQRCTVCNEVSFPKRRICQTCKAKDHMEEVRLPDVGTVVTFTRDRVIPSPVGEIWMAVVDFEQGGRFYGQVTDIEGESLQTGMPLRFTFRRFHEGGGYHNYFWKLRPSAVREG